jgi:hypothetical protein
MALLPWGDISNTSTGKPRYVPFVVFVTGTVLAAGLAASSDTVAETPVPGFWIGVQVYCGGQTGVGF